MLVWGALWGGLLGILWPGHEWPMRLVIGALLGALAGRSLRDRIRAEFGTALRSAPEATADSATAPPAGAPPAAATAAVAPAPADPSAASAKPPAVAAPELATVELAPTALAGPPLSSALAAATPPPADEADWAGALLQTAKTWLLGGNTVVRAGVLVLFIGLAFLARYAVENALLPPQLRLALIGLAAIVLFVLGFRLRLQSPDKLGYALSLQGAGVATLYLTLFAAFRVYQFLPYPVALLALSLICALAGVVAILQNAVAMAFIGFAGAYATPVLLSTGQTDPTGLFTYYLLLAIAIAAIAWLRAWRSLNLLGFFATFGVATAWGVLHYSPEQFASTEPFLLAFFVVFVAITVMYATRHALSTRRAVDATLVFGIPIAAFSLQSQLVRDYAYASACSSLAFAAFYLALGWWLVRRQGEQEPACRWLAECCAALALGFVTLAVPLALDAHMSAAVWAIEGAGVYWMGRRQGRWLARAAGLALQLFAALSLAGAALRLASAPSTFLHPLFVGAVMLAGAAFLIAWCLRTPCEKPGSGLHQAFLQLENESAPLLFWVGFLWWELACNRQIVQVTTEGAGLRAGLLDGSGQIHLQLLAWVASAFALHLLALPGRARPWPVAATPAWTVLPLLLAAALHGVATLHHVFEAGGWLAWPLLLLMHFIMLRRLDDQAPQSWWPWVHAGGVWLLVLLAGNLLVFAVDAAQLWQTAWAAVILLVAGTLVLLLLSRRAWFDQPQSRWPLDRFARAYLWTAAAPLALALALGALLVALSSDGNARPLPYIPLLNPTDLAVAMALVACALWLSRQGLVRRERPPASLELHGPQALAAIAFIALNTAWLRVVHHWAGVPWQAGALNASFLVQAGFSILWTLIAMALMLVAGKLTMRRVWMLGAGLLALTVLKLFVVDLSNRGGSERIFVFIAVGLLMLVVGYFAPMPPSQRRTEDAVQAAVLP